MAKKKQPSKPRVRRTIEIDVATKRGAAPQDVLDKIKRALDEVVGTEVFEPGDTIIVRNDVGD